MVNWETKAHYIVGPYALRDEPGRGMPSQGSAQIIEGQLYYLLETKWLKPVLMKAMKGSLASRPVDIVQTIIIDERTDFLFDGESHMLVQLRSYDRAGKIRSNVVSFSDYTEANGLKVPMKATYVDGIDYVQSFQFNVTYDPGILLNPPTVEAGPEAWKPKK